MIGRMPLLTPALLASLLALSAPAQAATGTPAAANVRVYRCVGSNGQIALQDVPCRQGRQQVLELARPKDPPPSATPAATAPAPSAAPAVPAPTPSRVVVVREEPLFECTTPDGERYTADDGEGNPRWVPGPLVAVHLGPGHAHGPGRPPMHRPSLPPGNGAAPPRPPGHGPHASVLVPAGGQWIRDSCQRLTRQEACRMLDGQRWALISRYNSALSSEREQLVRQQRRVEERMERQPCGR